MHLSQRGPKQMVQAVVPLDLPRRVMWQRILGVDAPGIIGDKRVTRVKTDA